MTMTDKRVVLQLIKNLTTKKRQHYTKAQYLAFMDASAIMLSALQQERADAAPPSSTTEEKK